MPKNIQSRKSSLFCLFLQYVLGYIFKLVNSIFMNNIFFSFQQTMDVGTSWIFICQHWGLSKTFRSHMDGRCSVLLKNNFYKAIITNVTVWIKQREERGRNLRSQRHSRPKGVFLLSTICSRLVSSKPQNNTHSTVINSRGGIYKKKTRKWENTLSTKKTIKKKEDRKKRKRPLDQESDQEKEKKNDIGQEK